MESSIKLSEDGLWLRLESAERHWMLNLSELAASKMGGTIGPLVVGGISTQLRVGQEMPPVIHVTEDAPGLATFMFPNGCRIVVGVTTTELAIEVQDENSRPLDKKKIIPLVLLT